MQAVCEIAFIDEPLPEERREGTPYSLPTTSANPASLTPYTKFMQFGQERTTVQGEREGKRVKGRQAVLVKIYAILLYSTGQLKEPTHRGVQAKGVGVQQGETLAT